MNFFKSVFADEPDPPNPEYESENGPSTNQDPDPKPDPTPASSSVIGGWNFGDLIKTIATKSETVIETYRRDLQEFGSGLKKEIEVAQGSLENVGSVIDEFGNTVIKGTAQIISQGTDAILASDHDSSDPSSDHINQGYSSQQSLNSKKYSRFESQVRAIQSDVSTYCEEPEDLEEYEKWRSGFVLEKKREEIEGLLEENGAMESIYNRVAPNVVDDETFWCRYYFRVYKLKQAEDVRANLVKRAISVEEDEELSWDVDDEEYGESGGSGNAVMKSNLEGKWSEVKPDEEEVGERGSMNVGESSVEVAKRESGSEDSEQKDVKEESSPVVLQSGASEIVDEKGVKSPKEDDAKKQSVVESSDDREPEKKVNVEEDSVKKDLPAKSDEKVASEVKNEAPAASSKDSDASSAGASQSVSQQPEDEDLGWDEIEDLSTIDEKKEEKKLNKASGGVAELQKRLSIAEEDEDFSWDIDDDDEPTKA